MSGHGSDILATIMAKKVQRSKESAVVGGVVSGLAQYFEQDPLLFRLGAVFALIISGVFPILVMYLLAWYFVPMATPTANYTIDHE